MKLIKKNIEHYEVKTEDIYKPNYEVTIERYGDGRIYMVKIEEYNGVKKKDEVVIKREILDVLKFLIENKIISL